MPIISVTEKAQVIEALAERHREVFAVVPLRDGESVSGLLKKKALPFHDIVAAPYSAANAVRYSHAGATVVFGIGSKHLASKDEVAYLTRKFPQLFEVSLGLDDRDPDDVAVDAQRERLAHEKERARLTATAEAAEGKLRSETIRADDAERSLVSYKSRAKLADDELAAAKLALSAKDDDIAELKEKLARALSPVKSQGGTTDLADAVAEATTALAPDKAKPKPK